MRLTGNKLTGNNAHAYLGFYDKDRTIDGGNLAAGKLYFIVKKARTDDPILGALPAGSFFRARKDTDAGSGGRYFEIDARQLFKTSAEFTMEQGVVEIGDDYDPSAKMLDGIVNVSGSVSGIFRYNEDDGNFDDVTVNVMNQFLDAVEEEGGACRYVPRDDARVFLLILMNANATDDQYENWLYVPVIFSSVGLSFGNTDAQTRELSWTKGQGKAIRYAVRKAV